MRRPLEILPILEPLSVVCVAGLFLLANPAVADPIIFSTGDTDLRIAIATRPDSSYGFEIESADDFVLAQAMAISGASFTGLVTGTRPISSIGEVRVEIYQVFPDGSDTTRTSGSPTYSTSNVPTRVNSPSDVALDDRDATSATLTFTVTDFGSITTANSVQPGGIKATPNQATGGSGPVTGEEVRFDVDFTSAFALPAGHYFLVPQVEITNGDGAFLWLSAPKPIVPPGTPFAPDLQSWTRDGTIDPDWLRVGTDIVGGTALQFNAVFSLDGQQSQVPEPASLALLGEGLVLLWSTRRRRH